MDVAAGQAKFAIDLLKAVVTGANGADNAILGPLSITLALAMVAAGARGPTLSQIAQCIKLPEGAPMHQFSSHLLTSVLSDGSGDGGPQLALANQVWVEQSLKLNPKFQQVLKESYGAEAASVDFVSKAEEVLAKVNAWAKDSTHGKIEDLLPPGSVNPDTRLVLANALYFKGKWKKPFVSYSTRDQDFFLLNGNTIKVPMMHTSEKQYMKEFPTFKALRLPYESNNKNRLFSMFILLPHEKHGLAGLEKTLDVKTLTEDLKHVDEAVALTKFQLPKFKVSCGYEVPQALQALGLTLLFEGKADLTGMVADDSEASNLCVSNVFHKTFVEVNEAGTEAAAATAITVQLKSLVMSFDPVEFVCDHPFLFVLKAEVADVILFTGRITDPSAHE